MEERSERRRRRALIRRRRWTLAAAACAALLIGVIAGAASGGGDDEPAAPDAPPAAVEPSAEAPREQAREPVDRLTLREQVGQMIVLRFAGTSAPGYVREVLRERRAAGAILFRDNVIDPPQLRALTDQLHGADPDALVCVDQEGGEIRIVPWAAPERSAPQQGAEGTARADATAAGRDLRAAGIDVSLAPVGDVPSVPGAAMAGREFSTDAGAAAQATAASVRGWLAGGVLPTVKHFPGLGGATVNTDEGSAMIDRTRSQLDADLEPFRAALDAGAPLVMASHAVYPALDGERIASQSPAVIDGLLRGELGFEGVVMTDSLEAAAVRAVADVDQAALASARAGVDVMLTTGRGSYIRVFRALLGEARRSPVFRERVRASAARVLEARNR